MFELEYIEKDKIAYLKTKSSYSKADVEGFLLKATEFAKKFNCYKILLDHRDCKFEAKIIDIHLIAKYLDKYGFNKKYKGAVVYNQDSEKYGFANTVAYNWSFGIMRFFDDYEMAKEWLLENQMETED
ncbi:hypothetical protein [Carboxylicivirga marina]|uniref:hypothetical protein n=1 Tax=Carboxylicivirga marina TaxID=2800988 RepID=UPI0025955253|nr:hypothetical protein [uncultured Carboxylicivirga sp.]